MRTILGSWSVHKPFTCKQRCGNKDHLTLGCVPLPFHPVHLLLHLCSFCNHTYPSHEEISSKRPLTEIKIELALQWPLYFFSCVLLIPLENVCSILLLLSVNIPTSVCSVILCPLLSVLGCFLSCYTAPSTLLPVRTTLSCDPQCLDVGCKRNSWSANPPE